MADRGHYVNQYNCQKIDGQNVELQAGRTGRPFMFNCSTDVKVGGWFNAAKAQMHYGSAGTGEVTGFGSALNSEMYLPNKTMGGGSYTSLEVNLNFQASTVSHDNPAMPVSMAHFKVGGTQAAIDTWEAQTNSCLFSIQGLTAANDELFDASGGNAAYAAGLRIMVGSTPYWIMLTSDCSP